MQQEAAKVSASPEYLKKESVRQHMQDHIVQLVKSGEVTDQASVDAWCSAADMALKALKMVPFEAWQKMAGTAPRKR